MLNTKKRKGCLNLQHTKAGGSQKHILQISLSQKKKKGKSMEPISIWVSSMKFMLKNRDIRGK